MRYRFVKSGSCEEGNVKIGYSCEHCGDMREPSIVVGNGGTWYCDTCHDANGGDIPLAVLAMATGALADEYEKIADRYRKVARSLRRGLKAK